MLKNDLKESGFMNINVERYPQGTNSQFDSIKDAKNKAQDRAKNWFVIVDNQGDIIEYFKST